jgi:hypothetical protein
MSANFVGQPLFSIKARTIKWHMITIYRPAVGTGDLEPINNPLQYNRILLIFRFSLKQNQITYKGRTHVWITQHQKAAAVFPGTTSNGLELV